MSSLAFLLLCIQAKIFYLSRNPAFSVSLRKATEFSFPFTQNGKNISCAESFSGQKSDQLLSLFFIAVFRVVVFFLKLPADQKLLIRRLQLFIYAPDQLGRHSLTKLQLLFQLAAALLILSVFNIIAYITFIIQIAKAFHIGNRLLHKFRLKFCL